ncbi:hypothetical protein UT300012_23740 [Paraclostridium bifermentans]
MKMSDIEILECKTLDELVSHPDWKGFKANMNKPELYNLALKEIEVFGSMTPTLALQCLNYLEEKDITYLMNRIKEGDRCGTKG